MNRKQRTRLAVLGLTLTGTLLVCISILTLGFPQGVAAVGSGPVSCWRAEGNANDSCDGNNGTLVNGAGFVPGKVGQAFGFSSAASQYVKVAAAPNLVITNTGSLVAWINPTGAGSGSGGNDGGMIVNKEGEYEVARWSDGSIHWAVDNTNPGWVWHNTNYKALQGQWTHVAVTYDNGTVKTYANGAPVDTYSGSGSIGDVDTQHNDLWIGGRPLASQYFQGDIDEVAVYNRALTATEVNTLYEDGNSPTAVALMSFGAGSGFDGWPLVGSVAVPVLGLVVSGGFLAARRRNRRDGEGR